MARSKKFSQLLKKIDGKRGSVFEMGGGSEVGKGKLSYRTSGNGGQLYVDDTRIPISSIRNIVYPFNPEGFGGALIFVDPEYGLARRYQNA